MTESELEFLKQARRYAFSRLDLSPECRCIDGGVCAGCEVMVLRGEVQRLWDALWHYECPDCGARIGAVHKDECLVLAMRGAERSDTPTVVDEGRAAR